MRSGLAGICIGITLCLSAQTDDLIVGSKGRWKVSPVGLGTDDPALFVGSAPRVVAEALAAARNRNRSACYGLWDAPTNSPPPLVKACFDEWQSYSQRYVYAIMEEAVLNDPASTPTVLHAVSIAPVAHRGLGAGDAVTNEPTEFRAQVIFVGQSGGRYKLLPLVADEAIERALSGRAARSLYQPRMNFTEQALLEKQKEFHREFLRTMQTNGQSPDSISSMKERFEVDDTGVVINNWAAWTNQYKALILDPPVMFERRDPVTYNFRDLLSAFRSYKRALFTGDAKTLLAHADESGTRILKRMRVDPDRPRNTYDITYAMTRLTVLLTAGTKFEGKEFALVFWRAENEKNPKNGPIALQSTIFVREGDEYKLSGELQDSYLGSLLKVARAPGGIWKHSEFEKIMPKSQLPPSFYTIH